MKTNLKKLRKAAGWSNADDFARSIGLPPKTYRNYEQGVRSMNLEVACDICNALGCTLNDIEIGNEVHYAVVSLPAEKTEVDLSSDERQLVDLYRNMDAAHRETLMQTARAFSALSEKDGQDAPRPVGAGAVDAVRRWNG